MGDSITLPSAWHTECKAFQRQSAKFATCTMWITEASPSPRKRFPISLVRLKSRQKEPTDFVTANHCGNHGKLFNSLPNDEVRL